MQALTLPLITWPKASCVNLSPPPLYGKPIPAPATFSSPPSPATAILRYQSNSFVSPRRPNRAQLPSGKCRLRSAVEGVQCRKAPSQLGGSAPGSLQPSEPAGIQAPAHTAVCSECAHSGSTVCTQNQRGLWSWTCPLKDFAAPGLILACNPGCSLDLPLWSSPPTFTHSSFNAQHLPPFAVTVAVIISTAWCVWGWDPRLGLLICVPVSRLAPAVRYPAL